jgi:glycosyltransferase involved in cell wall biosynthesis
MESSTHQRLRVSTVLLVKNGMRSLPAYYESMQDIDDIIVLDGGSTDGTVEFLKHKPNCRVFPQNPAHLDAQGYITDFSALRNEGYALAKHPWILCIDADEELSPAFKKEVERIVAEGKPGVYYVKRTFLRDGKPVVMFPGSGFDQIRLFHKTAVKGCVKPVHERLDVVPGAYKGKLNTEVTVPLAIASSLRPKYNRYLQIELTKRASLLSMSKWLRWMLLRTAYSVPRMIVVWLLTFLIPKKGPRFPWGLVWEQARYSVVLTRRSCPLWRKSS